jgi:hypothetical protein
MGNNLVPHESPLAQRLNALRKARRQAIEKMIPYDGLEFTIPPQVKLPAEFGHEDILVNGRPLEHDQAVRLVGGMAAVLARIERALASSNGGETEEDLLIKDLLGAAILFAEMGYEWQHHARIYTLIVKLRDARKGIPQHAGTAVWMLRGTMVLAVEAKERLLKHTQNRGALAEAQRIFLEDLKDNLQTTDGFDVAALFPMKPGQRDAGPATAAHRDDTRRWKKLLETWKSKFDKGKAGPTINGKSDAVERFLMGRAKLKAEKTEAQLAEAYRAFLTFACWEARFLSCKL